MEVREVRTAAAWLHQVAPLLAADEVRHNLAFGIADTLVRHPETYPTAHLWAVIEGEEPVGAMLQTPPYNAIVCRPAVAGVLDMLVDAAASLGNAIPGVTGIDPEARAFAEGWAARTGEPWTLRMRQGIYACAEAASVPPAPGRARTAGADDRPALVDLVIAFTEEAVPGPIQHRERLASGIDDRVGDDPTVAGYWVWEDGHGRVVSISGHGGRTPTGIRIGPVYTPPEHRQKGYATSLVAAQTSWLLDHAVASCFLFTDLGNPTSNAVYRRIGYEQRYEALDIRFGGR